MARPALFLMPKVDDFRSIDIAWLRRRGVRNVGYSGRIIWSRGGTETGSVGYRLELAGLRLQYRHTSYSGSAQSIDELIPIVTTATNLGGGRRHWFACPSCARRCRILYGGSHFRCRICRGARYESQYQHAAFSTCDRRWRIREHLEERGGQKWPWGLDDGFSPEAPTHALEHLPKARGSRREARTALGDWGEWQALQEPPERLTRCRRVGLGWDKVMLSMCNCGAWSI